MQYYELYIRISDVLVYTEDYGSVHILNCEIAVCPCCLSGPTIVVKHNYALCVCVCARVYVYVCMRMLRLHVCLYARRVQC